MFFRRVLRTVLRVLCDKHTDDSARSNRPLGPSQDSVPAKALFVMLCLLSRMLYLGKEKGLLCIGE